MTRVIVIGGTGFYGSVVAEHIARLPAVEVVIAGRRPPAGGLAVDLTKPSTFAQLKGAHWVVNCSDSVLAPPDQAIAFCQSAGIGWLDMGAEAHAARRLLGLEAPGAPVVIGVGVFPGLSTSLAHHLVSTTEGVEALTLGVRISPLSGAGMANCELMTHMFEAPSLHVHNGQLHEGPPLGGTHRLPVRQNVYAHYLGCGLPDAALLAHATEVPSITTALAVNPGFLRFSFRLLAALTRWAGPLRPVMRWMSRWLLRLSRGMLLKNVGSPVQLTAQVKTGVGTKTATLEFHEGRQATAVGVASVLAACLEKNLAPGIYTAPDVEPLPQLLARVQNLLSEHEPVAIQRF